MTSALEQTGGSCKRRHRSFHKMTKEDYGIFTKNSWVLLKCKAKKDVHLHPLPPTFLQIPIYNALDRAKSCSIPLHQRQYLLLFLSIGLLCCSCLRLVYVPEASKIDKLS